MADDVWDEYEDDEEEAAPEAPKPTGLREALKAKERENRALAKQLKDLNTEVATLRDGVKSASLKDLLREKGVDAKVEKWIVKDGVEPTAEAVDAWLADNGKDFGYEPGGETASTGGLDAVALAAAGLDPETVAALQQMQTAEAGALAGATATGQLEQAIASIDTKGMTFEAGIAALQKLGVDIEVGQ